MINFLFHLCKIDYHNIINVIGLKVDAKKYEDVDIEIDFNPKLFYKNLFYQIVKDSI